MAREKSIKIPSCIDHFPMFPMIFPFSYWGFLSQPRGDFPPRLHRWPSSRKFDKCRIASKFQSRKSCKMPEDSLLEGRMYIIVYIYTFFLKKKLYIYISISIFSTTYISHSRGYIWIVAHGSSVGCTSKWGNAQF